MLDERATELKRRLLRELHTKTAYDLEPILRARRLADREGRESTWDYALKYIMMTLVAGLLHVRPSEAKIMDVHSELRSLCYELSGGDCELEKAHLKALEEMWPKLKEQLRNMGFYKFVRERAMHSRFILPYLVVLSKRAEGMEFESGWSFDWLGRYCEVPESDAAYAMVMQESTARSFTWRTKFALDDHVRYLARVDYKPVVVNIPGGLLPEYRRFGMKPEYLSDLFEKIVVYDMDRHLAESWPKVFDKPPASYGIDYRYDMLEQAFKDEALQEKVDILCVKGFLSYHWSDQEIYYYLSEGKKLLKPGGIMMFDIETMELQMMRCAISLGWTGTTLKPALNKRGAINRITKQAEAAGLVIEETRIDPGNKTPTFVWFRLRKP